ncbi:hypothetical protein Tsubulata_024908 [Turnera subulata]|uniref:Uncharacterized protein n=1 Tax=Turnera subulata TaxID=218843 RepID=A0A9Q0G0G3_9ROSI|nr:hypothetical protein Tsubulata_024908 [Turnera subulata]
MAVQAAADQATDQVLRRTVDFHPCIWDDFFIQQASSQDKMLINAWSEQVEVLKEEVRKMLTQDADHDTLERVKLVDAVLRLGIGYHFEKEIEEALEHIHKRHQHQYSGDHQDLVAVALRFRLLRQHGYYVSSGKWRIEIDFKRKIPFARDRMVENYYWALAVFPEPEHGFCRITFTKWAVIATILDDMHDAYGTFDELQLFINTIERWDTSMDDLPEYMKHCFELLLRCLKEYEEETTKRGRPYCAEYLKEAVIMLVKSYFKEATWFKGGHVPPVEEYRQNGAISCDLILFTTACVGCMNDASKEVFYWLNSVPKILITAGDHCRLMDDIATHEFEQKRGHVASVVECYMKEHGVSKEEAHIELQKFIESDWKIMNEELVRETSAATIPKKILRTLLNYLRTMEALYKDGFDAFTDAKTVTKEVLTTLLVTPIPVEA